MIGIKSHGSFSKTLTGLTKLASGDIYRELDSYGRMGVDALARATPIDSGETAQSWTYKIERSRGRYSIEWYNTNVHNGSNVAILLQYGHGTGTGGYVQGRDFINPAIQPIFDRIAADVWKKVSNV